MKKIFSSKKHSHKSAKPANDKANKRIRFKDFVDFLIEHHLFKPISLSIILCFAVFKIYDYSSFYIAEYKEKQIRKVASTPIKINISEVQIDFDIDEDQIVERRIKQGDTLLKILSDIGTSEQDIFAILNSLKKFTSPKNLGVGDMITITYRSKILLNKSPNDTTNQDKNVNRKVIVNSVSISPSPSTQFSSHRNQDGTYEAKEENVKLTRYISRYYGSIKKGLFVDGVNSGISPTSMMNMINLYGYDIDFQRDLLVRGKIHGFEVEAVDLRLDVRRRGKLGPTDRDGGGFAG